MASSSMLPTTYNKLARCQHILGYKFRDLSLLEESLTLRKNRRLATAGDTYVQVALVDRWFSIANCTRGDFSIIQSETVSNQNLANLGFHKGLQACTSPECTKPMDMADTVEAILGAVYRDALFEDGERNASSWDEFERVVARLGINHHLIASDSSLRWSLTPMRTTRKILPLFFSRGNHIDLAKMVAGMSAKPDASSGARSEACPAQVHMSKPALHHAEKVNLANDLPVHEDRAAGTPKNWSSLDLIRSKKKGGKSAEERSASGRIESSQSKIEKHPQRLAARNQPARVVPADGANATISRETPLSYRHKSKPPPKEARAGKQ